MLQNQGLSRDIYEVVWQLNFSSLSTYTIVLRFFTLYWPHAFNKHSSIVQRLNGFQAVFYLIYL